MPTKTPDTGDGPDLEAMFAAARADAPEPPADLLARIAADADLEADRRAAATAPRSGILTRLARALGRHRSEAGGLVAATLAGLWIGVVSPGGMADPLAAIWGGGVVDTAAFVDPVSAYDLAFLGE